MISDCHRCARRPNRADSPGGRCTRTRLQDATTVTEPDDHGGAITTSSCTLGNLRRDDVLAQVTADGGALPGRAPMDRSANRSFERVRDPMSGQTCELTACTAATTTKRPKANDLLSANRERWRLESDIAVDRP
jgi:hypothetical protein